MSASQPPVAKRGVPWGLFIVLGVYAALVAGYIWATWWNNPVYQAAQSYDAALEILGVDDGRKCSEEDLRRALGLVLEAARLAPGAKDLAEHAERLRWRFDERHLKIPIDLARHAEIVSAAARRVEASREGWLPVSAHERGWTPAQVLTGPRRAVLWSSPGFVLIVMLWAYGRFGARARRAEEHEAHLKSVEREVEELAASRRRAPPESANKPASATKPASGSRNAVRRRPPT